MDDLFSDYQGHATAIALTYWQHYRRLATRGELVNAALIGLWQASKSYDPARDVPFKSWSRFRIKGAIFDELRNLSKNRFQSVPFGDGSDCVDQPLESYAEWDADEYTRFVDVMAEEAHLSDREKSILTLHLSGFTSRDISELWEVSCDSIHSSWCSVRHKVSAWIINEPSPPVTETRKPEPKPGWVYVPPHLR